MAKFEIYRLGNEFRYRLTDPNGPTFLIGQPYKSKHSCKLAIESVRENAPFESCFVRLVSSDDRPYFNLKASNGDIIATSETYSTTITRELGINSIKRHALNAEIEDYAI